MKLTLKNIFGAGLIALAFSVIMSKSAAAQSCAVPPTCDALGYTKTASDCSGMSVLKCPFDQSKIFCVTAEEVPGPIGSCGIPEIGDILYSDMSCSSSLIKEKFPIGVIFDANRRLAIALDETQISWSNGWFNVPGVANQSDAEASDSFNGKSDTKTIVNYCKANGKSCPAAEYAYSYTTKGTKAGDWYLPALGELRLIDIQTRKLNSVLTSLNKTNLGYYGHWTTSEASLESVNVNHDTGHAWIIYLSNNPTHTAYTGVKSGDYLVRPILAF